MILLKPKRALATLLSFQIALFSTGPAHAATLMSNSDVLRMLQNGSASEQIETQVCVAEPHFDVANRNALAAMGIPNKIIQLMILRQNGGKCEDTPSAARNPAGSRLALPQDSHRRPTYERTPSVTSTRHTSHLKPVGIVLLVAAGGGGIPGQCSHCLFVGCGATLASRDGHRAWGLPGVGRCLGDV